MQAGSTQGRIIAAVCCLAAGMAGAGFVLHQRPGVSGPDPAQIRALRERIEAQGPLAPAAELPSAPGGETDIAFQPPAYLFPEPVVEAAPPPPPAPPSAKPTPPKPTAKPQPAPRPVPQPQPQAPPPAPRDPVGHLALVGVAEVGGTRQAFLVNLETKRREALEEGGSAFGFTVRQVAEESVRVSDGEDDYVLRLSGQPSRLASISGDGPAVAAIAPAAPVTGGSQVASGRTGRGGRAGRGGFAGAGGAASGGTVNLGSGSRNGGRSASASGQNRAAQSRRAASAGGGTRSGAAAGGGFPGGRTARAMMRQAEGGQGNAFAAGATAGASNPQTARRRGQTPAGDGQPGTAPEAIVNPQTQRRTGQRTGPAFGLGGA